MAQKEYGYQKEREGYSIWTLGPAGSRQDVIGYARTARDAQRKINKLYAADEVASTPSSPRHHATKKKSPARLDREIEAAVKLEAMKRGETVVTNDEEMNQIEALIVDAGIKNFRSLPNPQRVGVKDQYIAWIGPSRGPGPDELRELTGEQKKAAGVIVREAAQDSLRTGGNWQVDAIYRLKHYGFTTRQAQRIVEATEERARR